MANFTARTNEYYPKSLYDYKTFTTYSWNHYAPEPEGNCTWFAFGETSRIVQECLGNEDYNIQYESGNEFMSSGPSALYWISNAANKGAWSVYGDTRGNYDPASSPIAGTLINIEPGDILCYWSSDGFGHVEVAEKVENGYVYCSGSKARVSQPAVFYYSRTVVASLFTVGRQHTFSGEGSGGEIISWSNDYFQGVIRNPYVTTAPVPEVSILPQNPSGTIDKYSSSVDISVTITVSNISPAESITGIVYCDGMTFISESTWTYGTYTIDGVLYRYGTKSLTLRYYRESNQSYTTTKYLRLSDTFNTGSINLNAPIRIDVEAMDVDVLGWNLKKKRRKRKTIYVKI